MTLDQLRATAPTAYGRVDALRLTWNFRWQEALAYIGTLTAGSVYDTAQTVATGETIGWVGTVPPPATFNGIGPSQSAPSAIVVFPPQNDWALYPSWSAALAAVPIATLLALTTNIGSQLLPPSWQTLNPSGVRCP
jgi:hypothetical protein